MATSNDYSVLEAIPEDAKITDFIGHKYENLRLLNPQDFPDLAKIAGRSLVRKLAYRDPTLLECSSSSQVVDKLKKYTEGAYNLAEVGTDVSFNCAVRNNIEQLIELYR